MGSDWKCCTVHESLVVPDNMKENTTIRCGSGRQFCDSQEHQGRLEERCLLRGKISANFQLYARKTWTHWLLLLLSSGAMMTAFPASSILSRLYFVDGGSSRWLVSWFSVAGWPITCAMLLLFCLMEGSYPTPLTWKVSVAYGVLGFISAADNLMYAWAYAYLPASTGALLSASSLAFTAIFAFLLVGKRFNSSTVNAVGMMTVGAVILGLDSTSDRPAGVTDREYAVGFLLDIGGSVVHGLIFALSELLFIKLLGRSSFRLVLEAQTATSFVACIFTSIGVVMAGDFSSMRAEAQAFAHGPSAYYLVLVGASVTFQLGVLGSVGVLYLSSTLFAGVLNAARVPVTSVASVICFHDPMGPFKILANVVTVWGFGSYAHGSYVDHSSKQKLSSSLFRTSYAELP